MNKLISLKRKTILLTIGLLVLGLFSCQHNLSHKDQSNVITPNKNQARFLDAPYVVLVSVDGMRHDYIERYHAPNLLDMKKNALTAEAFRPIYPSITFPNHYSIITGLYPKNHHLLANDFYDRTSGERYQMSDKGQVQNGKWYGGMPLWLVAERQGMISASYFWVGSDVAIHGQFPSYYKVYDTKVPNEVRVAQVLEWLHMPKEQRPHFLTLYYSIVDSAGHEFGPESKEVKEAVLEVDHSIGELIKGLEALDKEGVPTNLFIVSDHGMQTIDPKKVVAIPPELLGKDYIFTGRGAFSMVYTTSPEKTAEALKLLKKVPHIKAYKREDTPKAWHMDTELAGDIIVQADPGAYLTQAPKKETKKNTSGGTHGYDPNQSKDMGGILIAKGPLIKNGKIGIIENINLYPFLAALLGLEVTDKIDGELKFLKPFMNKN